MDEAALHAMLYNRVVALSPLTGIAVTPDRMVTAQAVPPFDEHKISGQLSRPLEFVSSPCRDRPEWRRPRGPCALRVLCELQLSTARRRRLSRAAIKTTKGRSAILVKSLAEPGAETLSFYYIVAAAFSLSQDRNDLRLRASRFP
jgi:hypothetical protein